MRTYETLFIIQPEAGEDDVQTIITAIETLITNDEGVIERSDVWSKRRLAYKVKKHNEGIFILLRFKADPGVVKKLKDHFKLNESIIRHLVVLFDEKTLRLEAEQMRRNEAAIASRAAAAERDRDVDRDRDRRRSLHSDEDAKEPVEA